MGKKLSHHEFVRKEILERREPPYRGIHVIFSGFNKAFRDYFKEEPRPIIDKMVEEGYLKLIAKKGGPLIMLADDTPGEQIKEEKKKPTTTAVKATKAKAKAKPKVQNPKIAELMRQQGLNAQISTRRNTTIFSNMHSLLEIEEITHEEALEVLRRMEKHGWSSLGRITELIDALEKIDS